MDMLWQNPAPKSLWCSSMTTKTGMNWLLFQLTNLEWLGELYASMQRPCLWPVSWVSWSLAQFHRRHVAHGTVMYANTYKWIQESLGAFNAFKCFHIILSQASASPRLPWAQNQKVRQTAWIEQQITFGCVSKLGGLLPLISGKIEPFKGGWGDPNLDTNPFARLMVQQRCATLQLLFSRLSSLASWPNLGFGLIKR